MAYNPLEELMNDGTMETTDTDIDDFGGKVEPIKTTPVATPVVEEKRLPDIKVMDLDDPSKNQLPAHPEAIDPMANIDMECSVGEDDDDDIPTKVAPRKPNIIEETHVSDKEVKKAGKLDFGDCDEYEQMKKYNDEIAFKNKKLIDESTKGLEKGIPTKDIWKKINKENQKTLKKANGWGWKEARKPHEHISGDPEQDMKDFNHDMGSGKGNVSGLTAGVMADGGTGAVASAGGEGGMGESKNNNAPDKYTKKCKALLEEMGFDICKDNAGCHLVDLNKGKEGNSIETVIFTTPEELFKLLKDYIDDFVLCPLCDETGEYKDKYEDWVDWYTPAKKELYPNIQDDIDTCDMICHHCNDIKL